jgi:hypothetical protein
LAGKHRLRTPRLAASADLVCTLGCVLCFAMDALRSVSDGGLEGHVRASRSAHALPAAGSCLLRAVCSACRAPADAPAVKCVPSVLAENPLEELRCPSRRQLRQRPAHHAWRAPSGHSGTRTLRQSWPAAVAIPSTAAGVLAVRPQVQGQRCQPPGDLFRKL